jgi:hypothetical protein
MRKESQEDIANKAIIWCQVRDMETTPQNIVCALDNLGLIVTELTAAQVLRAVPSGLRSQASRENGKRGGRPRKEKL